MTTAGAMQKEKTMSDRPPLSAALAVELDTILREAGIADRGGDLARATQLAEQAWDCLPEPKLSWDFYPQIIARSLLRKAVAASNKTQTRVYLDRVYDAYADADRTDHFVNMLEGDAWYLLEEYDAAYLAFKKIYDRYGRQGFRGDNTKHLKWLMAEHTRRENL